MPLNIQRTSSANIDRRIKALITGHPGSGKTLIASTFPNPFYLTTEGLMMSIADRNIPYHKLTSSAELEQTVHLLQQKASVRAEQFGFPVDTIVIDTIDDVSRMMLKERMKEERHETAQLGDYGWLKGQLAAIVGSLRNLDMNVVLTCHLKTTEVHGISTYVPAIEGGFSMDVAGYVDLSLVLRHELVTEVQGTDVVKYVRRYLQAFPDHQFDFIKDHSGKLPAEIEVNFEDDYDRLATIIYGAPPEFSVDDEPPAEPPTVATVETPEEPAEGTLDLTPPPPSPVPAPEWDCEGCGIKIDEDQHDLSQLKKRKALCRDCLAKS